MNKLLMAAIDTYQAQKTEALAHLDLLFNDATMIGEHTDLTTDSEKRLSLVGLIVRINDKVQRLLNLMVKNNREAQNEPSIDAFKDLACYGIIAQIVQNGKWGK